MPPSDFVALRDLLQPIIRYRGVALLTTVLASAAVVGVVAMMKPEYEATMKVLVRRERLDPMMTASAAEPGRDRVEVTEDELNSEVELLKSRDLLQRVASASVLLAPPAPSAEQTPNSSARPTTEAMARAVTTLQQNLQVEAIRKSTLIQLRYRSSDAELSAAVLRNLAHFYVEKHLALHRPVGAYDFFTQQARTFSSALSDAEQRLAEFGRVQQVVVPTAERDSTLQALAESESSLWRTRTLMSESVQRITTLRQQLAATPGRQTTQIHTASDTERVRDLKTRLFELERKQADMRRFYNPQHPPLLQLADQIAQTRAAVADAEQSQVTSETTDQNPTHQWLRDELARATTERDGLEARVESLSRSIDDYRQKAARLDDVRAQEDGLIRAVKTARDNYELYQRKQEEARISDALDQTRVADVVIAEEPVVPALASNSRRLGVLLVGLVLAVVAGIAVAVVCHLANPRFRTREDAQDYLGVPVLAALSTDVRVRS